VRHYWLFAISVSLLFLLLFGLVQWLDLAVLVDPTPMMSPGGSMAAVVGIGLLIGDVVLPAPASLIMIAHGAVFGAVLGTFVSLIGGLGASLVGFLLGRRGSRWIERVIPESERVKADAMLARWGVLAVIATRPIPILAETTAILAGASTLRWGEMTWASIAGILPACILYAVTGATAATLDNAFLIFGLVMLVAGVVWLVGRRVGAAAESRISS